MSEALVGESIVIHFDLENNSHDIPIEQSIYAEIAIQDIVHNIQELIFGSNKNIKLLVEVLPAEKWSHKKRFLIKSIWWITTFLIGAASSGILDGILLPLTWKTVQERTTYWIEKLIPTITANFLSEKNQDLFNKWIYYWQFTEAYEAKHKLYYSSLLNEKTTWICFSDTLVWLIPRNEFAYRLKDSISDKDWPEPEEKFHELIIVSPIISEKDRKLTRKVKDILDREEERKSFEVYMQDEEFYNGFLQNPFVINTLLVKMKYDLKRKESWEIKVEKKRIMKVYKFNDTVVTTLPSDAIISPAPRLPEQNLEEIRNNGQRQQSLFWV